MGTSDVPALYIFATCVDTVRTIPTAQHDPDRPEDLLNVARINL